MHVVFFCGSSAPTLLLAYLQVSMVWTVREGQPDIPTICVYQVGLLWYQTQSMLKNFLSCCTWTDHVERNRLVRYLERIFSESESSQPKWYGTTHIIKHRTLSDSIPTIQDELIWVTKHYLSLFRDLPQKILVGTRQIDIDHQLWFWTLRSADGSYIMNGRMPEQSVQKRSCFCGWLQPGS
jgi:hypothetical protein